MSIRSNILSGLSFIWRANRRSYVLLVGASVLRGLAAAGIPTGLAWILSVATVAPELRAIPLSAVLPPLVLIILCTLAERVLEIWRSGALDTFAHDVRVTAEDLIVRTASSLDVEDFDRVETHDKLSRASQAAQTRPVQLAQSLLQTTAALAGSIGTAGAVLALNPAMFGLALLTFVPAWYLIQRRSAARLTFIFEATPIERRAQYFFSVLTARDAAKDIRANDATAFLNAKRALELRRRREELDLEVARLRRADVVGGAMSAVAALITWGVLAAFLFRGSAGIGEVLVFVYAFQRLQTFLASLSWGLAEAGEAGVLMSEVNSIGELTGHAPRFAGPAAAELRQSPADFTLTDVSYTYPGSGRPALDGVSVAFPRGQISAVVGPNGSGKTTLVKVLSLLLEPSHGHVSADGDVVDKCAANRKRLSVVFQDSERFALSFRENIELGRSGPPGRYAELIKQVGLAKLVDGAPEGADSIVGPEFDGAALSGGEWQRLLIARGTFLTNVDAVIMDEASSGLDPVAEYDLMRSVRAACRDKIGVIVSHRLSSVSHADIVYFMEDGKIVESGPPSELLRTGGPFARMFNVQARATGHMQEEPLPTS